MTELTEISDKQQTFLAKHNIDEAGWRTLKKVIFPNVQDDKEIIMALEYCKARGLDIFKRPVHLIPMYNKETRGYRTVVMPGVYEIRTTAARTGEYSGMDSPTWGELINVKSTKDETMDIPSFCQITVYRTIKGQRVPFSGPEVYFQEACSRDFKTRDLNSMWAKRPRGQLQKCAEAAALRCAFPDELGGVMSAEEMEGQTIDEPIWTPSYADDEKIKFDQLIKDSDSLEFYVFMKGLNVTTTIDLYGSFPKGEKTKGKEICRALEDEGYRQIQDVLAALEEASSDNAGVVEIWSELSDHAQAYIMTNHLSPEQQETIQNAMEVV